MFLVGCAKPGTEAGAVSPAVRTVFAQACPTPSRAADLTNIRREIEASIAKAVPPDTLATEWLRLNDGAKACRGQR